MTAIKTNSLDHVALWVADPDALSSFACEHLGMHVIERTDDFTLVGADARRGKLTLFRAEGPRDRGPLERVVLRVRDLAAAVAVLPDDVDVEESDGMARFDAPEGLRVGLVEAGDAPGPDYDLDHVVLRVPDTGATAGALSELGFAPNGNGRLSIADKDLVLETGAAQVDSERPLLNHIAMLVDSAAGVQDEAERRGLEIDKFVDAANTLAVFVWGPDRIKLEYVEHKPGFALT
jgi:catechol 2,3-dioxygenase-like lactoylglutathione lyase family enzyme